MNSSLPLHVNSPLRCTVFQGSQRRTIKFYAIPSSVAKTCQFPIAKSHICFASNNADWEREEIRWIREEQRWLREEQRWIREESRWNAEREALIQQISELKLQIEELKRNRPLIGSSISDATIAKLAPLVQFMKLAESGSTAVPMELEAAESMEEVVEKEVIVQEVEVSERIGQEREKKIKKKTALRKGSEGEEVRAMQEALQKLGFYSGEEDMEYSSFSSGTERAVKTWQASLGAADDGIMTSELLERLYMEQQVKGAGLKDSANGVAASVAEISEIRQTVVKEAGGGTEVDLSQHRVFLLGENRWEEPSRLAGRDRKDVRNEYAATKCLTCRGEGRLLCTECDGTGEPNIEPQFLEWIDEGAKCAYCEGLGYTSCDVCDGKTKV